MIRLGDGADSFGLPVGVVSVPVPGGNWRMRDVSAGRARYRLRRLAGRPDRKGLFVRQPWWPPSVLTGTCWLSVLLADDAQALGATSLDKVVECGNGR